MRFTQAIELLIENKRVRNAAWRKGFFIAIAGNPAYKEFSLFGVHDENGYIMPYSITQSDIHSQWELLEESNGQ